MVCVFAWLFVGRVELGPRFALAVLLVGPRAELLVGRLVSQDVVRAVELLALVEGHLLEDVVLVGVPFLLLHQQVVGRRHLVVLVVLNKHTRLLQILTREVIFKIFNLFMDDWNSILSNNDSFHLNASYFVVPIMITNISYLVPFVWISLKYLLN